jgi:hypothetical protein
MTNSELRMPHDGEPHRDATEQISSWHAVIHRGGLNLVA